MGSFSSRKHRRAGLPLLVAAATLAGGLASGIPAAGGAGTGVGAPAARSAAVAPHRTGTVAASCPTKGGIPFTGALSGGTVQLGPIVSGSGIGGSVCGLLELTTNAVKLVIPRDDFTFSGGTITILGLVSLPASITVDSPAVGTVKALKGGDYASTMHVTVSSSVSLLGFTCTIGPFTPVLTTGRSGSLTGSPFTGTLAHLSGKLVANTFTVPPIEESPTCPGFLAVLVNLLVGLPMQAGQASLTSDATLSA